MIQGNSLKVLSALETIQSYKVRLEINLLTKVFKIYKNLMHLMYDLFIIIRK